MTAILEKVVERAVRKNYIPAVEKEAVKQRIIQLSQKYGFSPDDFAIATCTESDGMNPKAGANGNCYGIIQWCNGSGIGTIKQTKQGILSLSVLQQLDQVDRFYEANKVHKLGGNLSAADLYLTILMPPAAGKMKDPNAPVPNVGLQASWLHPNGDRSQPVTKNSLDAGLRKRAEELLGEELGISTAAGSATGIGATGAVGGMSGGSVGQVGIISAVFSAKCNEIFPKEFNLLEAVKYVGCKTKIASSMLAGNGLGYPATGMQVPGASQTGVGEVVPGAPICAGCLIWPFKERGADGLPTWRITSPKTNSRCFRGRCRPHQGYDFGTPQGTPLLACGDGVVVMAEDQGSGYGNVITIQHKDNLFTRYGHLSQRLAYVGLQVKQGQLIGLSGGAEGTPGAGTSSGPHLHFEVRMQNDYANASALEPRDYCK